MAPTCTSNICEAALEPYATNEMMDSLVGRVEDLESENTMLKSRIEELESTVMRVMAVVFPPSASPSMAPTQFYYDIPLLNDLRCEYGTDDRVFTNYNGQSVNWCARKCRNTEGCQYFAMSGSTCIGCANVPRERNEGWVTYAVFEQPTCGLLSADCNGVVSWATSSGQFTNPEYYTDFEFYSKGATLGSATFEDFTTYFFCRGHHSKCTDMQPACTCNSPECDVCPLVE